MLKVMTTAIHGLPTLYGFEELIDGWVVGPENRGWLSPEMNGPIMIDNGAWGAHTRGTRINPLDAWRVQVRLASLYENRLHFVVLPDCIGDWDRTIKWAHEICDLSGWWYNRAELRNLTFPLALVLQPGYEMDWVDQLTEKYGIQWLFIGGPDWDFKRRAMEDLRDSAYRLHVGRVCSMSQLIYCYAHPQVESVDNSTFSNGLNHKYAEDYRRRLEILRHLDSGEQTTLGLIA